MKCTKCVGTGKTEYICPYCVGNLQIRGQTCGYCNGSGCDDTICDDCKGSGETKSIENMNTQEKNYHKPLAIYEDERGAIFTMTKDTLYLFSEKGARRAAHYHRSSSHTCYLTKGAVDYYERPVGSNEKPTKQTFGPFEPFYTGPMLEHLMVFLEDQNEMVCISHGDRDQTSYETDLVRLDFDLDKV